MTDADLWRWYKAPNGGRVWCLTHAGFYCSVREEGGCWYWRISTADSSPRFEAFGYHQDVEKAKTAALAVLATAIYLESL